MTATPPSPTGRFDGKVLLITGGTGSLGNALVEHILSTSRDVTVRVFSRDELKQHVMRERLGDDDRVRYLLGDVRDVARLRRALTGVDLVIHAAALKQVPACEYNPFEAIQTNVIGTQNLIEACIDTGVTRLIGVSTDKAVNPVNLYGASKLCAERLLVHANAFSGGKSTRFAVARYGNVMGSRGSVIPLFLKQRTTGRFTITDPRMTRFWITLPAAAAFVARCGASLQGGEIYVPKLASMRVTDLARAMNPEAKQEIIGIRPGEKVHEVLLTEDESRLSLEYDDHYVVQPDRPFFAAPKFTGGKKLPDDFRYTSDANDQWLGEAELKDLVRSFTES